VRNAFPATLPTRALAPWMRLSLIVSGSGGDLPCQGAESAQWVSEDPGQRAIAAVACRDCRALRACAEYAVSAAECWGVWGGVDRSSRVFTDA
jgi:transcription factor WhiB